MEIPDKSVESLARELFCTHNIRASQMSDAELADALAMFTPDEIKVIPALAEPVIHDGEIFISPQFAVDYLTPPSDDHLYNLYSESEIPKGERRKITLADEPTDIVAQRMRIAYPKAPKGSVFYAVNAQQFARIVESRPNCARTTKLRDLCNRIRKMRDVREYLRSLSPSSASAPRSIAERGVVYVTTSQEDAKLNLFSIHATHDMSIMNLDLGSPMPHDARELLCMRYGGHNVDLAANAIREALASRRTARSAATYDRFNIHLSYLVRFARAILEGFILAQSIAREYDDMMDLLPQCDQIPVLQPEQKSATDVFSDDESDSESSAESDTDSESDSAPAPAAPTPSPIPIANPVAKRAIIEPPTPAIPPIVKTARVPDRSSSDARLHQLIEQWTTKNIAEMRFGGSDVSLKMSSIWFSFRFADSFDAAKKLSPKLDIKNFCEHMSEMPRFRDRLIRRPKDNTVAAISGFILRKK